MRLHIVAGLGRCLCVALLMPALAHAQSAGGYSIDPSKGYNTTVTGSSPAYTQDRVTAGSRFWLLDPGRYEAEVWWSDKFNRDGTHEGLLQAEVEIGLAPHLQLDIYQNFALNDANGQPAWGGVEGSQIELRIAFARNYNEIPLNPVLYLEYRPRHDDAERAEVRLLLGGDVTPSLLGLINLYFETNINTSGSSARLRMANTDMEFGATGALTYAIDVDHFRIGIEGRLGADQHGNDIDALHPERFYLVGMVGPNILLKLPEAGLKLTATCFFGLAPHDARVYPLVIMGKAW